MTFNREQLQQYEKFVPLMDSEVAHLTMEEFITKGFKFPQFSFNVWQNPDKIRLLNGWAHLEYFVGENEWQFWEDIRQVREKVEV